MSRGLHEAPFQGRFFFATAQTSATGFASGTGWEESRHIYLANSP